MIYLEGNIELAKDILTLLDLVNLNLESKLKIDILTLNNTECYNNKDDGSDEYLVVRVLLHQGIQLARLIRKLFVLGWL